MIERVQKQVIFEEAAKRSILSSQLLQLPDILRSILGVSDIDKQIYGLPLAPIYTAKSGELIEVPRIANFFTGLSRDIKVADISLTNLENDLLMFNLEMWSRMQLLKNRATDLSKKARVEKNKAALGASWLFTETFSTTRYIDMENTSAWIDTAEGIAFLPSLAKEESVPMQDLSIVSSTLPTFGDFLGSNPKQAFDGLDNTNWRTLFTINDGTKATATVMLKTPSDLTAISVEPVGFGIELTIEADTGNGFQEVVKSIIYNKKTFSVSLEKTKAIRVGYKVATSVLPKVVGIREVVLYKYFSNREADVFSTILKPNEPFTQIKITPTGEIPTGTKVSSYYRTSTGAAWVPVENGAWYSIYDSFTESQTIDFTQATPGTTFAGFRGLYAISLPTNTVPISLTEGTLEIGTNQFEVSAFKKDWIEEGDFLKILSPEDFQEANLSKTWTSVPTKSFSSQEVIAQYYGNTNVDSDDDLIRGGSTAVYQRRLNSSELSSSLTKYNHLVFTPLTGTKSNAMLQFNYNYRFSCWLFCPRQFSYQDAKYWFYQGYRKAGRRAYREIGKSYGTFSIYINGNLVTGDELPYTIYDDDTVDGGADGKPFNMVFNTGWNKFEIFMNVVDPDVYGYDDFEASGPYLQLSLYPSIFDPEFNQSAGTFISKILASSSSKPVTDFDLLWNLPKDPTFWSWASDRQYLYFNTNQLKTIDGYYMGTYPRSILTYKSVQSNSIDDLYIKLSLEREDDVKVSPILTEYNVMVR